MRQVVKVVIHYSGVWVGLWIGPSFCRWGFGCWLGRGASFGERAERCGGRGRRGFREVLLNDIL